MLVGIGTEEELDELSAERCRAPRAVAKLPRDFCLTVTALRHLLSIRRARSVAMCCGSDLVDPELVPVRLDRHGQRLASDPVRVLE